MTKLPLFWTGVYEETGESLENITRIARLVPGAYIVKVFLWVVCGAGGPVCRFFLAMFTCSASRTRILYGSRAEDSRVL